MTPEQDAQTQHDPPYEDMIRNRRRIAPGHWSNKDIDCLLRRLDEARTERDAANRGRDAAKELAAQWGFRLAEAEEQWDAAAADARRQAIEECAPRWRPIDDEAKRIVSRYGDQEYGPRIIGWTIYGESRACHWWQFAKEPVVCNFLDDGGNVVRLKLYQPFPLPPAPEEGG